MWPRYVRAASAFDQVSSTKQFAQFWMCDLTPLHCVLNWKVFFTLHPLAPSGGCSSWYWLVLMLIRTQRFPLQWDCTEAPVITKDAFKCFVRLPGEQCVLMDSLMQQQESLATPAVTGTCILMPSFRVWSVYCEHASKKWKSISIIIGNRLYIFAVFNVSHKRCHC